MLLTFNFKRLQNYYKKEVSASFLSVLYFGICGEKNSLVMSRSVSSSFIKLIITYFAMYSATGYENAYDLLERRNQRFYEPGYFQPTAFYDDRNHFFNLNNRNPRLEYKTPNSYFSKFGNGYDNIGNGIPSGRFHPFRRQISGGWRFDRRPFHERIFNNFDFDTYPNLKPQPDYSDRIPSYYPSFQHHAPVSSVIYGNKFRGNNDFTKTDRFLEDNEDQKQKKTDEFYQKTQEGVNMNSLKKEKAGEQLHSDQIGENKSSLRSNKVVKKGRTTKGFAVHHHKDETGNSTTFFDETSDFGGQSDLRDISDEFGTRKTLEQITHKGDEKYFSENEGQTGNYGSGLLVGNQRFEKDFSSIGGHEESAGKFHTGNENEDLEMRKTYQYLNGDRFEYTEPHIDNYY